MSCLSARTTTFLLGIVLSAAIGCAQAYPAEESDTVTGDDEIVAKVLGNSAVVHPDRLEFPRGVFPRMLKTRIDSYREAIQRGEKKEEVENVLLVSDRQKDAIDRDGNIKEGIGNPYGYIRRALSYRDEGSKTIVMTEQATIEEVFKELDANGEMEIGVSAGGTGQPGQVTPQFSKKFSKQIPVIDLSGKELFEKFGAKVRVKQGRVTLNTDVDLGVEVGFFKLKKAHVIVGAQVDSVFELEVDASRSLETGFGKTVFQGRWPVGSIGPIPVTAGITADIKCSLRADGTANVTAGARASIAMKGGVRYENGKGADPTFEKPSFKPEFIKPTFEFTAKATAVCRLEPQIEVLLYDAAGPTVTPSIIATLEGTAPPPTLAVKGGLEVNVGGTLKVFGKDVGEFNKTVFTYEKELWRGSLSGGGI